MAPSPSPNAVFWKWKLLQTQAWGLSERTKEHQNSLPSRVSHESTLAAHVDFKGVTGDHQSFKKKHTGKTGKITSMWWYGKNESPKPYVPRCRRLNDYDQQRNRLLPIVTWKATVLCMVDGIRLSLQLERVTLKLEIKDKFSFWILSGYFHFGTHLAPYAIKQSRSISPSLKPPSLGRKKHKRNFNARIGWRRPF